MYTFDLSRHLPGPPPASFPQPSRGNLPRYIPVTQHPDYQQPPPPHSSRPPPHIPVPPTYPINGHGGADSQALGPILPQSRTGYVNDHISPPPAFPRPFPDSDTRVPDRTHPPSYSVGGFSTPGRPGVPEPSYLPVPSHGGSLSPSYNEGPSYGTVSSHASGSRSAVNTRPTDPTRGLCSPTIRASDRRKQSWQFKVGINYLRHPDHKFRLRRAVDDAWVIAHFLHDSFGFEWRHMKILTDDQPGSLPTEANIRAAMRWLVRGAEPDDALFFYFSGHATQVKDTNGDETDGYDECICAEDYMGDRQFPISPTTPGIIVDDDINRIMVQPLPRGCRLTALLDCCHSGTLLDLPFIYDSHGRPKPLDNPSTVEEKSSPAEVVSAVLLGEAPAPTMSLQISLSACKDSESAYEVPAEGGALRQAFVEYMKNWGNHGTCLNIIQSLRISTNSLLSSKPANSLKEFTVPEKPLTRILDPMDTAHG
ncbi:caspase domain-containing protein [Lactarius vividus]|nr:caspase domain-containing protein [Lactarius vividus]